MTLAIQPIYADSNLDECYGLGQLTDGTPVVWECLGHSAEMCMEGSYIPAIDGDHFTALSGACGIVRNGQLCSCGGNDCPGSDYVHDWPGDNAPVLPFERESYDNIV